MTTELRLPSCPTSGPGDALSERATELAEDVRRGLAAPAKELPPKWFYDERGSQLFDEITRLDEYYPTRREREILLAQSDAIVRAAGSDTLVELGSGTSDKTRHLLDAMRDAGLLRRYIALDVSEETMAGACAAILDEYPGIEVEGVVADFSRDLHRLPHHGNRLVAFLGGTYGNFYPEPRAAFLRSVRAAMTPGEAFLLGTDLVKDTGRLERAYDDAVGVTAAFNLNVLEVVNRELGADFDLAAFEHVARFDTVNEWIEMALRSTRDQVASVPALGLAFRFAEGEELRTEISAKFRREGVERELAAAGFRLAGWWTDAAGDFALSLSFAE